MTTAVLAAAEVSGGFSWKTLLIFVGAAIMLAFFSSLGILARIRERGIEQRRDAQWARDQRAGPDEPGTTAGPPGTTAGPPGTTAGPPGITAGPPGG